MKIVLLQNCLDGVANTKLSGGLQRAVKALIVAAFWPGELPSSGSAKASLATPLLHQWPLPLLLRPFCVQLSSFLSAAGAKHAHGPANFGDLQSGSTHRSLHLAAQLLQASAPNGQFRGADSALSTISDSDDGSDHVKQPLVSEAHAHTGGSPLYTNIEYEVSACCELGKSRI